MITAEEQFKKNNPQDGNLPEWAKKEMLEFAKYQIEAALKAAILNVGLIQTTPKKLNAEEYQPFITADDNTLWVIDKQSILDSYPLNLIK